jgi:hypothetical protein
MPTLDEDDDEAFLERLDELCVYMINANNNTLNKVVPQISFLYLFRGGKKTLRILRGIFLNCTPSQTPTT